MAKGEQDGNFKCDWESGFAQTPIVHTEDQCGAYATWRIGGSEASLEETESDHSDVCEEHLVPMLNAFYWEYGDRPMLLKM